MSQKTNPTGLRLLKNNQNFSCPGFADFFFTENYHYGFEIENYISAFLRQTQYSKAFFSAKNQYRNYSIWLFLQDSRADKTEKQSFLKYKSFKKSQFLKNYSKLAVFRTLYNSEEKRKNLVSTSAKQILRCSDFSRGDFVVDTQLSGRHILMDPSLSFCPNKPAKNELHLGRKIPHNKLQTKSGRDSEEKRGKKSKEKKTEWIRNNYLVVLLFFFSTRDAIRKYHQHSFFDSEKSICNARRKNFFSDYYLLKSDFRKLVVNDFLKTKQSKKYYTKAEQLGQKLNRFKVRPKYLNQIELKNAISLTESKNLAEKMMPTISRSGFFSYPFNCLGYYSNVRATETRTREKTEKTLKSVAKFDHVRGSKVEQLSNSQKFKTCFTLDYCLESLYSVFEPRNLDFTKQDHTQQNSLKIPTIVDLQAIRFIKDQQNVMSLLNQIVILLENRVSFRQIKSLVSKDFSNFSEHFHLKGLRIACSGRLGGRSKKAQKAKMQSANFGQTSLSAFSSKLTFGSQNAHTPSGLIGVKLWLCFKTTRF